MQKKLLCRTEHLGVPFKENEEFVMSKKIEAPKELFRMAAFYTVLFYVVAHGHRFSNTFFSGDSLLMIYQNDAAWEVALGRFMHPIFVLLRGAVESPFLISVISVTFYVLSVYFVLDFLEIKSTLSVVAVAALMTCNSTVVATNATFLPYADFYVISLFLAVLGVWLMKKETWYGFLLGVVALSISLGTYQAYICVAIAMVMIHFLFRLMDNKDTMKNMWMSLGKYLISFAGAGMLYYAVWKLFQKVFGIWTADTYNGMSSIGDFTDDIFGLLGTTYSNVFQYFCKPDTFVTLPFRGESMSIIWVYILRGCNLAVVILLVVALVIRNVRCKTTVAQRVLQVGVLLLFPFGVNIVCFISQGMEHILMMYAVVFVYVLALKLGESIMSVAKILSPWSITLVMLFVIVWSNIVYSNQVYVKKDLQDKAAQSLMNRIVYEIEHMPGYVAGETPVAFWGNFTDSDYIQDVEAFEDIVPYGMGKTALQYAGTEYVYMQYILNVNMNLTRLEGTEEYVAEMPIYPAEGSVAYNDGVVVVKISELK